MKYHELNEIYEKYNEHDINEELKIFLIKED
jgi:hypothetical protein